MILYFEDNKINTFNKELISQIEKYEKNLVKRQENT